MFGKWRRACQERLEKSTKWYSSWQGMNAWAWWLLDNSQWLDPPLQPMFARPEVQLWDDASGFSDEHDPTTWSVFDLGQSLVVREAKWQRKADLNRGYAMVQESNQEIVFRPTVTVRDAPVSGDELTKLLKEATPLHIPLVMLPGETDSVTDVGSCGFEFFTKGNPPVIVSMQWSGDIPDELEVAFEWIKRLHSFLRTCLEPPDPQSGDPGEFRC